MSELLIEVLKAASSMFLSALVILGLYLYARSKAPKNPAGEKLKVYACGESYPLQKASIADANLFVAIWKDVFKPYYRRMREKGHTGVLSDWLMWMILFLTMFFVLLLLMGGIP